MRIGLVITYTVSPVTVRAYPRARHRVPLLPTEVKPQQNTIVVALNRVSAAFSTSISYICVRV